MSVWSSGILTKKGLNLHAKVEAGTTLLKVTKMAVGSGVLGDDEDTQDVTALKHEELKVDISMAKAQDNGLCVITGILTNENVNVGFYAKEMALFAEDPDEGEILYQYASDSKPDWVPAITETKAPINIQLDTNVAISNAELINVEISPAGIVSIEVLNHYLNEHNEDNTAHTNLFKTLFNITTVNATKIKDKIKEYAGEKISEVFGVATVTKDTIKNQVKTYTKEVIKELLGITETTTEKIKAKILEWVQEQINTWLESQGIRYNIAQNGYICLGHFFGDAIIQWGSVNSTERKAVYALSFTINGIVTPVGGFGANGDSSGSYISDINDIKNGFNYKIYKKDGTIFTGVAVIKYIAFGW